MELKVGDLVTWKNAKTILGKVREVGLVIGFDKDDDPFVNWQKSGCKDCGEYKAQLEVVSSGRESETR